MPNDLTQQQRIQDILQNFHGIEPLRRLLWSELNYDRQTDPISRRDWTDTARNALANDPILLASGGTDAAFQVIYSHLNSDRLLLTAERPIISRLLGDHPYALFIFSNNEQSHWHFVNVKYDTHDPKKRRLFRRITISPYEKVRTASERIAMLDLESISPLLETIPPLEIQTRHEEAFDVEAVTKRFFEDYKSVFHILQDDLAVQTKDRWWAHDFALQFLNRCMFLYFIQRKRWLGEDTEFLKTFWESYRSADEPEDTFVEHWLNVLFFEAFNNRFHGGHRQFPDEIRKALAAAPYLNGGLFTENDLDEAHNFQIFDARFTGIFEFLENYNFTIAEDSPLDQEVAVDPEMIGKVYESLVNVSPETDERGDAGIFYTPRTEIDLMCRLALIIDADIPRAELQVRNEPLLPHFSFNIRCGDSLIQEIGGMNLAQIRADFSGIPRSLKARTTRLKNEKLKFFNNDKTCRYESEQELKHEELNLFRDLVDTHVADIKKQIDDLQELIEGPRAQQIRLDGTIEERAAHQFELEATEWRKQIEALTIDYDRLVEARGALANARTLPFVWDIAFVEIFADDKGGFDIVIGNPPYVRQENIADPKISREKVTTASKSAYKAKLARSVYQAFPRFFSYKRENDVKPNKPAAAVSHKLDAKSDLYIYFYFHGLSRLNPKGSFCFITSNSWLDVGYGKDLQEFTLKHCHIKQIIDNQSRRSFASADVNTVICLFSAPDERRQSGLDCTARFVSFNTPFEAILDPVIFYEIETASERGRTQEHRIDPISQRSLLKSGIVDASPKPKYTGDKWGGKYLRAPDIYWTILEKGQGKLVRLGDVVEVRRGFTTGANEFFYLDDEDIRQWEIEEEFLKPVIKSPRECKSILIDSSQLKFKLFMCNKDREDLKDTAALEYIEYGESRGFNQRPSCSGRARWWSSSVESGNSILVKEANDTSAAFYNPDKYLVDCRLYYASLSDDIFLFLNSALGAMFFELYNRAGLGEGARSMMVSDYEQVPVLTEVSINNKKALLESISCLSPRKLAHSETEWASLDGIIFDALNLTQGERDAVYEAVIDLVEARLKKASSLKDG